MILTAALLTGPISAVAATLVDTGEPVAPTLENGAPYRAGQVTFTSNVQISSVQHFARVSTAGDITFALRRDNAGLPGEEVFSAVTTLPTSGYEWLNIEGLHWAVPAGTYWVSVERREGQTARLVRPFGSSEDGTLPPNPLQAEANLFPPDTSWFTGTGRTGWRVIGQNAPGIYGVGDLPGGGFYSEIRDATKVGGVIMAVGNSERSSDLFRGDVGVLWSSDQGLVALPPVVPGEATPTFVSARDITADGRVIAGSADSSATNSDRVAVLVTDNGTTNTVLGTLPDAPRVLSYANAISDDGTVAYGQSLANPDFAYEAFRWTSTGGLVGLGFLNPGDAYSGPGARGISSDGSVMVGVSSTPDQFGGPGPGNRAFRYVAGAGMTALPLLPGGAGNTAFAVTPDGNVALGAGDSAAYPNGEFIRWNILAGTTEALGSADPTLIPGSIGAITADGQVAMVSFTDADFTFAKSYLRNAYGWFDLNTVMAAAGADLTGWSLDQVFGMSSDGTLVFGRGQHDGNAEGWVSELPVNYLRDYGRPSDSTPPVITPVVSGALGVNGWYRSDVAVTWNVTDAQSAVRSSQGCGPTTVATDTSGTTFTCTATSDGGTSTASVTIKRDTVAPIALVLSPFPGATYSRDQRVIALYLCLDIRSGITQCAGTVAAGALIDTATRGTKSFTVDARDQAGNSRVITVPYRVK